MLASLVASTEMAETVLAMVTAIIPMARHIGNAALTARQNKKECRDLGGRVRNLGVGLLDFARAAQNTQATVHGLERLRDAIEEALELVQ